MAVASLSTHVSVQGLTKAYGSNRVLEGIDLELAPGEVHALLGANGAGKSTLIKCLSGATRPSGGTIAIGDERHAGFTPRQALDAGIAVIYQHFSLVPTLSVADNVFLGSELRQHGPMVRRRDQEEQTAALFERLGVDISPRALVSRLTVAQQQLVEIAKAIHRDARLLILDEPTASLSAAESSALLDNVRGLREEGLAIVYVTHLLDEVFRIGDRITVLRDGKVSLAAPTADVGPRDLIRAISGSADPAERTEPAPTGDVVLAADGLQGPGIGPVSLELRRGEVVGIFGLLGSGRTELLETVFGIRPRSGGETTLKGERFLPKRPTDSIERGLALVPAERLRQSIFPSLSTSENVLIARLGRLGRFGVRGLGAERRSYDDTSRELRIRAASPNVSASTLSGGNQQKLAVGRWLGQQGGVEVLMLDEPTQGIDVGARAELYRVLRALAADAGYAVIFTSSSPEEIMALADRALVLHDGRIVSELARDELQEDRLLILAHQSEAA
jgi:ABC-type sugar transport system ATPase subunit